MISSVVCCCEWEVVTVEAEVCVVVRCVVVWSSSEVCVSRVLDRRVFCVLYVLGDVRCDGRDFLLGVGLLF